MSDNVMKDPLTPAQKEFLRKQVKALTEKCQEAMTELERLIKDWDGNSPTESMGSCTAEYDAWQAAYTIYIDAWNAAGSLEQLYYDCLNGP